MPCMTLEPFTARVLLANVDHVSSLLGIHEELMLLARGRATVSALSEQEKALCKGRNAYKATEGLL